MSGVATVGQVGAALNAAATQLEYQVAALKKQQEVVQDAGTAALKLIQAAFTGIGQNLDVTV